MYRRRSACLIATALLMTLYGGMGCSTMCGKERAQQEINSRPRRPEEPGQGVGGAGLMRPGIVKYIRPNPGPPGFSVVENTAQKALEQMLVEESHRPETEDAHIFANPLHVEIIAWAIKCRMSHPPAIIEECVIVSEATGAGGSSEWAVFVLERWSSGPSALRRWRASWNALLPWQQRYAKEPTNEELASFIVKTNFGLNGCCPYWDTLQVLVFGSHSSFGEAIERSIPLEERQRRSWLGRTPFY